MKNKGFTLIELIIVIGLLGLLIAALLAALDPIEQFNKGKDAGHKSAAANLYGANSRYYATAKQFAWGTSIFSAAVATSAIPNGAISTLISAGELKSNFVQNYSNSLARIYVTASATDDQKYCFLPESKAGFKDPNTIFSNVGSVLPSSAGCATSATTGCYWCVQ